MKMRRKCLVFLAIVLMMVCLVDAERFDVSASTPMPAFTVTSGSVTAGNEVTIAVELSNNPGIHAATLELYFDERLELIDVEDTGLLGGFQSEKDYDMKPYVLCWEDSLAETSNMANGNIVNLTFRVTDTIADGEYEVKLNVREVYRIAYTDGKLDFVDVEFQGVGGKIAVTSVLRGDMNGDGLVTDADAIYLLYYTFFPGDYPLNQDGDFNGDEIVTDADAIYLLYYTFFPSDYPL